MSRRSTRLTTKAEAAAVAAINLPQNDKQNNNSNGQTTKTSQGSRNLKKRKISNEKDVSGDKGNAYKSNRSKMKGKGTNSAILKDIPFDILLEIFRPLEPLDLLHLSRVSKGLHDFLTSDDVAFMWKLTYNNVIRHHRPPPCPDDTNVVFYTNYVYGRHCQSCSSGLGRIFHESAFIRLCSKCADNSWQVDKMDPSVRSFCNRWPSSSGYVILKAEYKLRLEEFKHAQKTETVQSYITERERVLRKRSAVGSVLAQWRKRMHRARLDDLRVIRYKRAEDIMKKLEAEARGNTINRADFDAVRYRVHQAPHVRKSHALTDSEWNSIRPDILDYLQDIRDNRAIGDMRCKLESRVSHLQSFINQWKIRPTAWWIASSGPISAFIKSGILEKNLTMSDFEKVEPQLRNIITSWKEETARYLATLIPQTPKKRKKQGSHNGEIDALELATTFFKCHWCTEPISYPRVLMHGCLFNDVKTQEEAGAEVDEDDMEDVAGGVAVNARGPREPRPPKEITPDLVLPMLSDYFSLGMRAGKEGVTFDEEASKAARDVITAYGEDPMTVTHTAMDENHARLECLRCSRALLAKKTKAVRVVMKWTMAVVHELEEHYDEPPSSEPAWGKIDSLDDQAKVQEAERKVMNLKRFQKFLSCNYCPAVNLHPGHWFKLYHLTQQHQIIAEEDTVSNHFSFPVDTSIKISNPAVKI